MIMDRAVIIFAGVLILGSLALAQLHSPAWLFLTGLVGLNLIQSSITGFCPAAILFDRLGWRLGKPTCGSSTPGR